MKTSKTQSSKWNNWLKTMLSELLNIKKMHLGKAEQQVRAARSRLEQSRQVLAKAHQELEDYQRWRTEEEKKIYAAIMGQQVSRSEVEQTRQHVMALRLHDETLKQKIEEARNEVSAAEQHLEASMVEQKKAFRTVEKYKAIIAEVQLEAEREQALHEEKEMEEIRLPKATGF